MSSTTTCKFFLQGNCKFGGRCKFYHPGRGQQGGGSSRHQAAPSHDRSDSSWHGRNELSLYREWNDGSDYGGGGGRRGRGDHFQNLDQQGGRQDRYHYTSPNYNSSHRRDQGKDEGWRGGGRGGRWDGRGGRKEEWSGGGGGREGEWRGSGGGEWRDGGGGREQRGGGGGRKEEWSGGGGREGEWRGGSGGGGEWRGGGGGRERRGGGGGRKGEWSGGGRDEREDRRSDNYCDSYSSSSSATVLQELAISVTTKDMENRKALSMWPLSCYGNSHCVHLPGLVDVSPEEVRFEAYNANSSGTSAQFLKYFEELCSQQAALICKYADPDVKLLENLAQFSSANGSSGLLGTLNKSDLLHSPMPAGSASTLANTSTNFSLFGETKFSLPQVENQPTGTSLFASSPVPQINTLAPRNLFFSPASAMGGSSPSSTQEVPLLSADTGTKPDEDTSELTEEILRAFKADVFVFKQIPECLPPSYLC